MHSKSPPLFEGMEIRRATMDAILQHLQEDEEVAREEHIRLELYRLALQRHPCTTDQQLDAVQAQINAAVNHWRVAKKKLQEGERQFLMLPA
jgi:NAD-specific glutamate dehydrogenase